MQVAFLGAGEMGLRMARAVLTAGHGVRIWNRTAARTAVLTAQGAIGATTPAEATRGAEIVIAMVRDDEASRRVWLDPADGALAAMAAETVAVESSTLSLGWVRELADACARTGRAFLDAPVVGSRAQAQASSLIHLVGGEADAVLRAKPVFEAIGNAVHHMGPSGSGATMKLIINAMLGVQVSVLAELLGVAEANGLALDRTVEALGQMPTTSPAALAAAKGMASRSFQPAFPVELVEKDLSYLEAMAEVGKTPVSAAARAVFRAAIAAGLGGENMTAVAKLYQAGRRVEEP